MENFKLKAALLIISIFVGFFILDITTLPSSNSQFFSQQSGSIFESKNSETVRLQNGRFGNKSFKMKREVSEKGNANARSNKSTQEDQSGRRYLNNSTAPNSDRGDVNATIGRFRRGATHGGYAWKLNLNVTHFENRTQVPPPQSNSVAITNTAEYKDKKYLGMAVYVEGNGPRHSYEELYNAWDSVGAFLKKLFGESADVMPARAESVDSNVLQNSDHQETIISSPVTQLPVSLEITPTDHPETEGFVDEGSGNGPHTLRNKKGKFLFGFLEFGGNTAANPTQEIESVSDISRNESGVEFHNTTEIVSDPNLFTEGNLGAISESIAARKDISNSDSNEYQSKLQLVSDKSLEINSTEDQSEFQLVSDKPSEMDSTEGQSKFQLTGAQAEIEPTEAHSKFRFLTDTPSDRDSAEDRSQFSFLTERTEKNIGTLRTETFVPDNLIKSNDFSNKSSVLSETTTVVMENIIHNLSIQTKPQIETTENDKCTDCKNQSEFTKLEINGMSAEERLSDLMPSTTSPVLSKESLFTDAQLEEYCMDLVNRLGKSRNFLPSFSDFFGSGESPQRENVNEINSENQEINQSGETTHSLWKLQHSVFTNLINVVAGRSLEKGQVSEDSFLDHSDEHAEEDMFQTKNSQERKSRFLNLFGIFGSGRSAIIEEKNLISDENLGETTTEIEISPTVLDCENYFRKKQDIKMFPKPNLMDIISNPNIVLNDFANDTISSKLKEQHMQFLTDLLKTSLNENSEEKSEVHAIMSAPVTPEEAVTTNEMVSKTAQDINIFSIDESSESFPNSTGTKRESFLEEALNSEFIQMQKSKEISQVAEHRETSFDKSYEGSQSLVLEVAESTTDLPKVENLNSKSRIWAIFGFGSGGGNSNVGDQANESQSSRDPKFISSLFGFGSGGTDLDGETTESTQGTGVRIFGGMFDFGSGEGSFLAVSGTDTTDKQEVSESGITVGDGDFANKNESFQRNSFAILDDGEISEFSLESGDVFTEWNGTNGSDYNKSFFDVLTTDFSGGGRDLLQTQKTVFADIGNKTSDCENECWFEHLNSTELKESIDELTPISSYGTERDCEYGCWFEYNVTESPQIEKTAYADSNNISKDCEDDCWLEYLNATEPGQNEKLDELIPSSSNDTELSQALVTRKVVFSDTADTDCVDDCWFAYYNETERRQIERVDELTANSNVASKGGSKTLVSATELVNNITDVSCEDDCLFEYNSTEITDLCQEDCDNELPRVDGYNPDISEILPQIYTTEIGFKVDCENCDFEYLKTKEISLNTDSSSSSNPEIIRYPYSEKVTEDENLHDCNQTELNRFEQATRKSGFEIPTSSSESEENALNLHADISTINNTNIETFDTVTDDYTVSLNENVPVEVTTEMKTRLFGTLFLTGSGDGGLLVGDGGQINLIEVEQTSISPVRQSRRGRLLDPPPLEVECRECVDNFEQKIKVNFEERGKTVLPSEYLTEIPISQNIATTTMLGSSNESSLEKSTTQPSFPPEQKFTSGTATQTSIYTSLPSSQRTTSQLYPKLCTSASECKVAQNERCVSYNSSSVCDCGRAFVRNRATRRCEAKVVLETTLKLPAENFEQDLRNPNSAHYKKMQRNAIDTMWLLLSDDPELLAIIADIEVSAFTEGSLVIHWRLVLAPNKNETANELLNKLNSELEEAVQDENLLRAAPLDVHNAVLLSVSRAINPCDKDELNYCSSHAICTQDDSHPGGFFCRCKDGYLDASRNMEFPGEICEAICSTHYCGGHGICQVEENGNRHCMCHGWYFGERCDISGIAIIASFSGINILVVLTIVVLICVCKCRRCRRTGRHRRSFIFQTSQECGSNMEIPTRVFDVIALEENVGPQPSKFIAISTPLQEPPVIKVTRPTFSDSSISFYDSTFDATTSNCDQGSKLKEIMSPSTI